jgi:hypothetical protein
MDGERDMDGDRAMDSEGTGMVAGTRTGTRAGTRTRTETRAKADMDRNRDRDRGMDTDTDTDMDMDMERNEDRVGKGTRTGTCMGTGIQKGTGTFLHVIRPWETFEFEYLCECETEFENILGYDSGVHMGLITKRTEAKNLVLLSTPGGKKYI